MDFLANDTLTCVQGLLTLVSIFFASVLTFRFIARNSASRNTIPRVPSWIPFIGSSIDYFACLSRFSEKYRAKYGDVFYATILGSNWLFLHAVQDVEYVLRSNEKQVSMYQAIYAIAGRFLPREFESDYPNENIRQCVSRGKNWDNETPSVPHFINAMKPTRLRAWIPGMRETVREFYFADLPESGTMDLFRFTSDLVSGMTARVLLGRAIAGNKEVCNQWIHMVQVAEPEAAFTGPLNSMQATFEVAWRGERRAFARAREFLYPFIEAEIHKTLKGEPEEEDFPVLSGLVRSYYTKYNESEELLRAAKKRIANDIFMFTFAAVTNSYGSAAWVIFHVLRNTDGIGDLVRTELENSNPKSDTFPVLESLILEIGRLYTPGSLLRRTVKPFKVPSNGDIVPPGTMISINVAILHRNPYLFENPLEFHPKRFMNGDRRTGGTTFMPFGAGMHPCAGRRFAIMEIALFVVEALKQFEFKLLDDEKRITDDFAQKYITNIPRHPKLDPAQNNSIWRPVEPVMIHYTQKTKIA